MILKGKLFNNFLKEYSAIFEITSFELEFIGDSTNDCCVTCKTSGQEEVYFSIDLEDYEKLATILYENNKLDITNTGYFILKKQD